MSKAARTGLLAGAAALLVIVVAVAWFVVAQIRDDVFGYEHLRSGSTTDGSYSFRFVDLEGLYEELQIVNAEGEVVFSDGETFRDRDRNRVAWASDIALMADSGDVGSEWIERVDGEWTSRPAAVVEEGETRQADGVCFPSALAEAIKISTYEPLLCP